MLIKLEKNKMNQKIDFVKNSHVQGNGVLQYIES